MKKKPSKLKLDKRTVSNLNETDVNSINGGMSAISAIACPSVITVLTKIPNKVED
jgi:hypothetical protein